MRRYRSRDPWRGFDTATRRCARVTRGSRESSSRTNESSAKKHRVSRIEHPICRLTFASKTSYLIAIKSEISIDSRSRCAYEWTMAATKRKRARKHVQQELFRHGGKRKGAGRKPKGRRAGARHDERPTINARHPVHVVMRVVPAVGSMRRRSLYKAMRDATVTAALRERFRIVHVSLQRTHVHMLVEAKNKLALARGMQGFQILWRGRNRNKGAHGDSAPPRF
jgi:hypothetical protein